jgi:hypothetical protein
VEQLRVQPTEFVRWACGQLGLDVAAVEMYESRSVAAYFRCAGMIDRRSRRILVASSWCWNSVAHELVHLAQLVEGRLTVDSWHGVPLSAWSGSPEHTWPWEVEAYRGAERLVADYRAAYAQGVAA